MTNSVPLQLLRDKSVQLVTMLNTSGNYNTMLSVCIMFCTTVSLGNRNFQLHYNFIGLLSYMWSNIDWNGIMCPMTIFYFAYHTRRQYREQSLVSFFMSICIFIHFQCSQRRQITLERVCSAIYKQDHLSREEVFCPNKHMYKIMTYQKIFTFDLTNVVKYILGYISPTFPTATYSYDI